MTTRLEDSVLRRLFLGHQDRLLSSLRADRHGIDHPGLKGAASEERWRTLLDTHLPRRYRVSTGVVVDCQGSGSQQIDVIVHDAHYCPLFLDQAGMSFVPAESVYAVIEVKQDLSSPHLAAAAEKAASVRRLHRTTGMIVDRGQQRVARPLPPILAGIVSLSSGWTDGLGETFRGQLVTHTGLCAIDFGCALETGAFEVPEGGTAAEAQVSGGGTSLVTFFLTLVRRLQGLGTVPAIDWASYEQGFREQR